MAHPPEQPRCPECRMPHDLTPGSLPVQACARVLARIRAEDFDQWARELNASPPSAGSAP